MDEGCRGLSSVAESEVKRERLFVRHGDAPPSEERPRVLWRERPIRSPKYIRSEATRQLGTRGWQLATKLSFIASAINLYLKGISK